MTKPTYRARDVFELCISSKIEPAIQARLLPLAPMVEAAEAEYDAAATNSQLYTISSADSDSAAEARAVYTQRFQPEESMCRSIYNQMILSAPNRLCPLCGAGFVDGLDHYLPKSPFWEMAVMPINLVPACPHCNHSKHAAVPDTEEEQTIHPYYDDFDDEVWLAAFVSEIEPIAITYDVIEPAGWGAIKIARARKHFVTHELSDLFISRAGTELSEDKHRYLEMYEQSGPQRVRDYLKEKLYYAELLPYQNDWKTALYRALSHSDWFCEGGCLLMGDQ